MRVNLQDKPVGDDYSKCRLSQQDIQDIFDLNKITVDGERAILIRRVEAGQYVYTHFTAEKGFFEDGFILGNSPSEITPILSSDPIAGTFITSEPHTEALYIYGTRYPFYSIAATLATTLAARVASSVDVEEDGQVIRRSQMSRNYLSMATEFRRLAGGGLAVVLMTHTDINPNANRLR